MALSNKNRLELTWVGKENRPRLEPRILLEDQALSYHAPQASLRDDQFDNRLIFGDNLLALKALEQEFTGKVKCVFIDPPYNTGSAFEHYDDGVEHSMWLSMMRDRLQLLRGLMREDALIWITIDDNEAHYLKVMADEIFGRLNFIANVVWQKKYSPGNNQIGISSDLDHVLVYARNADRAAGICFPVLPSRMLLTRILITMRAVIGRRAISHELSIESVISTRSRHLLGLKCSLREAGVGVARPPKLIAYVETTGFGLGLMEMPSQA